MNTIIKKNVLFLVLLGGLALSLVFSLVKEREYNVERITQRFQHIFLQEENRNVDLLSAMILDYLDRGEDLFRDFQWVNHKNQLYETKGKVFLTTSADSVLFLSHNTLPVSHGKLPHYNQGLTLLENGWYYVQSEIVKDKTFWVFTLLKKEYRYKNKFLKNDFNPIFQTPSILLISDNSAAESDHTIYNQNGDFILSLLVAPYPELTRTNNWALYASVLFGAISLVIVFILLSRFFLTSRGKMKSWLVLPGLFATLFLLRFLMFYGQFPGLFYQLELFSASHYAANYLIPSLGDLLLNIVFVFVWVFTSHLYFKKISPNLLPSKKVTQYGIIFLLLTIITVSAYLVIHIIESLVVNSSLNLNVNFIFQPDIYHFVGFYIIIGLMASFHFLTATGIRIIETSKVLKIQSESGYTPTSISSVKRSKANTSQHIKELLSNRVLQWLSRIKGLGIYLMGWLATAVAGYFIFPSHYAIWLVLLICAQISLFNIRKGSSTLARLLISFFLYSAVATWSLHVFNSEKEKAHRQNVALRMATEQDPVAEFIFHQMQEDLFTDYVLNEMVENDPYNEETLLEYLKNNYFADFWARYDIQLTVCAPGEVLLFPAFDAEMECDEYFRFYAQNFGRPTINPELLFLDNNTGRNSYLVILPVSINNNPQRSYTLYLEFESRFVPKELGFPELLVDEQIDITRNLGNYSYAIYKDGVLTHKFGKFIYSIHVSSYNQPGETFRFFESDGFSHLLFNRDENTQIIVSKPRQGLLEKVAPFSYIFILSLLSIFIFWLLVQYINNGYSVSLNFKKRLQITIIAIVLVSVVAIGSASAWFIFNIYKNKNEAIINEKAHSILIEMENHFSGEPFLGDEHEMYLSQLLMRMSHIFFTDINIFSPQGYLISSSRSKVFDEGLISPLIHPLAFYYLKVSGKSLFVHNERIGELEYLSAYVPLRNINGDLIAYINLPYFAQQSELRNEISFFLVAFINIYLLLLLLSVVIAFFISNYVTRPLQIIRDSISRLSIGKINEKISWEREDEIGQLVSEYNRMIDELAVSAELLAKSERESAWREMAKQVAHEIKNPLTPMRLNVQYLQRAWKDNVDDWDERLERFTKTMVEQIDNLTIIAGEFSDFAKMPVAQNESILIPTFIPEVIDLYKGFEKVNIEYHPNNSYGEPTVMADRKQLLRVFNNLIKNAIQAYHKADKARIIILSEVQSNYCRIEIKDFGEGIAEDFKKNIFQPYFTTKTAGMGLGLAMVRSIIDSFGGHIAFESQKGEGTSFVLRLPLQKKLPD